MLKILNILILGLLINLIPMSVSARENVSDWYIKDFKSEIILNKDSSLDITETILADCGNSERHGIFRVLPTTQTIGNKKQNSKILLRSITNERGNSIKYKTINDRIYDTLTWKIGDPNKFVTGENTYIIKYTVRNAVRNFESYDELYWNLNGNFWELETDNYKASIIFPSGVNKDNLEINVYSGSYGEKNSIPVSQTFDNPSTLSIKTGRTLLQNEGITLSAVFPKNLISPYKPGFLEKYGNFFYILIPLIVFWMCFKLWRKYGDDPSINPTVAPEFEIPEKLTPIDMGVLMTDGILHNNFISATIINLAVNGKLKIKKIEKTGLLGHEDYELSKTEDKYKPSASEEKVYNSLFGSEQNIKVSSLKNKFYKHLPGIGSTSKNLLASKKLLIKSSRTYQYLLIGVGIFGLIGGAVLSPSYLYLGLSLIASSLIILAFSLVMPKRTHEGAELNRRIKGFKLFLEKVEKYRQQVLEKENVFEKFLPYAIMFGMTKLYINKMKSIYGEEYFSNYHPLWYYSAGHASFNVDTLSSHISSLSNSMASTVSSTPSSSGSGGGGFSGGGGGGGGGGGW